MGVTETPTIFLLLIDLNALNAGGIEQTFDTMIGQIYRVTFDFAGNPEIANFTPQPKTMIASAAGTTQEFSFALVDNDKNNGLEWVEEYFDFTATSSSTTLRFASNISGATEPTLDNVRVAAISTPALLPGLVALGAAALKRNSKKQSESEA